MRISDLDRDHSQIFVDSDLPDSNFLYARMRDAIFDALRGTAGDRMLDVAAGLGADAQALAERGFYATNAEPSRLLTELEALVAERQGWKDMGERVTRVRCWAEALPFRAGSFAGSFCKGSLDHFDDPVACIREMARVTREDGRVVLAVANMDAISLRIGRLLDRFGASGRRLTPGRRHSDAPADHLTRYDADLLRRQVEPLLHVEVWCGVSLLWGNRLWQRTLQALPEPAALWSLRAADRVARHVPSWADLIVVAGRPRVGV